MKEWLPEKLLPAGISHNQILQQRVKASS